MAAPPDMPPPAPPPRPPAPPGAPHLPASLILIPTFRCALRCGHCDLWRLRTPELPPALWRQRLLELAAELRRPLMVGISGGEPLLYRGIEQVIAACAEVGWVTGLATSTLPLDEAALGRLRDAGLSTLVVSLDGMGLGHDELRRKPGLYAHALRALALARATAPALRVSVVATVMAKTVGQLVSMAQWVDGQPGVENICYHALSANLGSEAELDPRWHHKSPQWPGQLPALYAELDRLLLLSDEGFPIVNRPAELAEMARFFAAPDEPLRPCDQHDKGLLLLPDGAIKLCPLQDPVGDLRRQTLAEVWRSARAAACRRGMRACRRNCHFITNFAYQRHQLPG